MKQRMDALRTAIEKENLDGLLVTHPFNRNYLTGFSGSSGALILSLKESLLLTDSRYTLQAKAEVLGAEVVLQRRALLMDVLQIIGRLKIRRLGFESMHLSHASYDFLKRKLPKLVLVPTQGLPERQRLMKDAQEQARMRQAARITDRSFHHVLKFIRPGVREKDLAAEMEHYMRSQGASGPSFETIVASGYRGALPHGIASDKKIAGGDLIVFDFGCIFEGYCSDMTRMVSVGPPKAEQKRVYGLVKDAQAAGLEAIRSGATGGEVDEAARRVIRKGGFGQHFGHSLGHGVGREVHEEPRLSPKNSELLQEGMAVTCEPGIYLEGKFGVRIEDLVFVTRGGHENLYRSSRELAVV